MSRRREGRVRLRRNLPLETMPVVETNASGEGMAQPMAPLLHSQSQADVLCNISDPGPNRPRVPEGTVEDRHCAIVQVVLKDSH